jgi:hypothetical protein
MFCFVVVQGLLVAQWTVLTLPLWLLFGFFGTSAILPYAVLSQSFARHLAGRANTALNLLVFVAAFGAQWAIGAIINLWPQTDAGGYAASGYTFGFGLVLLLQVISAAWYFWAIRGDAGTRKASG